MSVAIDEVQFGSPVLTRVPLAPAPAPAPAPASYLDPVPSQRYI